MFGFAVCLSQLGERLELVEAKSPPSCWLVKRDRRALVVALGEGVQVEEEVEVPMLWTSPHVVHFGVDTSAGATSVWVRGEAAGG